MHYHVHIIPRYNNDDLNIELTKEGENEIGNYNIIVKANNDNYNIRLINGIYSIVSNILADSELGDYQFTTTNMTYDGTNKKLEITNLNEGFSVEYPNGNEFINAGTYEIVAVITGSGEFEGRSTIKTATLIIEKAPITITADNKSSTYGSSLATLTSTTAGTVYSGDNLNINLTKADGSNAGTYTITVSASNSNYNITKVNGTYTINPKTLTASDLGSLTFSNATYTYNKTTRSLAVTNLPTGFDVSYSNNGKTNAGTYTVTATITGNSNYTGSVDKTATLTINKASVTVTADNKSSTYGSSLVTLTSTTTGTVYSGDNLNISLSKEEGSNAGTYTITVSASNDNYNITKKNGTYTINPKTLASSDLGSLTFSDATYTYNKTARSLAVTNLPSGFSASYSNNGKTNAGTYTVTATITGNSNYTGTQTKTAILTINQASVTVTSASKRSLYGDSLVSLTYTTSGTIYSGDNLNVSLSTSATSTKAGSYTITISTNNSNYNVTKNQGTYTVYHNFDTFKNNSATGDTIVSGNGQLTNLGTYGIRYQGSAPDNYVYFNCSDYNNPTSSTCELWRIVGVVDGKVKLVRNTVIGKISWDDPNGNGSYDGNEVSDWKNSTLKSYFNGTYYNSLTSATRSMISPSTWYLRTTSDLLPDTKSIMYNLERTSGTIMYGTSQITNTNIGLIYISDYGYAAMETSTCLSSTKIWEYEPCKDVNWIAQLINDSEWTFMPTYDADRSVLAFSELGYAGDLINVAKQKDTRPSLYLNSNVILIGDGSVNNPYVPKLN